MVDREVTAKENSLANRCRGVIGTYKLEVPAASIVGRTLRCGEDISRDSCVIAVQRQRITK